jgi:uncharacterized membrane protein
MRTMMLLLGAYHGINPGMGWLFAVALGMQQGSSRGVWSALPPIALGHALAVGAVLLAAGLAQFIVPLGALKIVVACILLAFGVYRLWRHRHPRYGGMRVGFRDLTTWSFLMASAHGAGFMVLPFVMRMSSGVEAVGASMGSSAHHMTAAGSAWNAAMLLVLHTLSYLVVTALAAWIVYRWLGLALLRTAWLNLDFVWAAALAVAGAVVLLT